MDFLLLFPEGVACIFWQVEEVAPGFLVWSLSDIEGLARTEG